MKRFYPIGTPGVAWAQAERDEWLSKQTVKRSYAEMVLANLDKFRENFEVIQYGALSTNVERYPLYVAKSKVFDAKKPYVLVTGGVHGYETSGVMGAVRFLLTEAKKYEEHFNLVVFPCISPWGFETVNRWNPKTLDPNRNFITDSPAEECANAMRFLDSLGSDVTFLAHFDLHETTDSDEAEFMPAKSARDGVEHFPEETPDGFYLVAPAEHPELAFQQAMNDSVRKVTHIAPPDAQGQIIGIKITQEGVVEIPGESLGLCMGVRKARFATTTEVYPDSPKLNDEICIQAQVACIQGGLNYIVDNVVAKS